MQTGVEFDEDKYGMSSTSAQTGSTFRQTNSETSAMQQWIIRHGLAKSPRSADFILFCIVGVNIIITIIVINYFL